MENFKAEEGTRMYLTIEEFWKLVETECEYAGVKRAFLFFCLTGLRRSDIVRLRWGDVHQQGDFTRIIFKQKKTQGQEYLDITPQAVEFMGERGKSDDLVFYDLYTPTIPIRQFRIGFCGQVSTRRFRSTARDSDIHLTRWKQTIYRIEILDC